MSSFRERKALTRRDGEGKDDADKAEHKIQQWRSAFDGRHFYVLRYGVDDDSIDIALAERQKPDWVVSLTDGTDDLDSILSMWEVKSRLMCPEGFVLDDLSLAHLEAQRNALIAHHTKTVGAIRNDIGTRPGMELLTEESTLAGLMPALHVVFVPLQFNLAYGCVVPYEWLRSNGRPCDVPWNLGKPDVPADQIRGKVYSYTELLNRWYWLGEEPTEKLSNPTRIVIPTEPSRSKLGYIRALANTERARRNSNEHVPALPLHGIWSSETSNQVSSFQRTALKVAAAERLGISDPPIPSTSREAGQFLSDLNSVDIDARLRAVEYWRAQVAATPTARSA